MKLKVKLLLNFEIERHINRFFLIAQSTSVNKASEPQAKAQPSVGPFNTKLVYLEDAELPARFKRIHPTQFEADVIEVSTLYIVY
jgi:hypothetical protein